MGVGQNIKQWRERRAFGQGELAGLVGISQNGLWRIEAERHKPKPATLRKIAEVLKVEIDTLTDLGGTTANGAVATPEASDGS